MIDGKRVLLRRVGENDWPQLEAWIDDPEALWGPFQRFQPDMLGALKQAHTGTGLLTSESGMLVVQEKVSSKPIGVVRFGNRPMIAGDPPMLDIGFVIADKASRGKGYATEATKLLVDYLLARYPTERISAITDAENVAAQRVLESLGFKREGVLRRASFRGGKWSDQVMFGLLRSEWKS
jgi:aminoglycoside 6'-N-acetyltransferase